MSIPKKLWRTVPEITHPIVEEYWDRWVALHPKWECTTVRDPLDPRDWETGHLWARCFAGAQIAGMIRLELLWQHGGIYVDSDLEPVRSLDPLREVGAFACREDDNCIPDAFMGAESKHPAIRACLDKVLACNPAEGGRRLAPWLTGPGVTTSIFGSRNDVVVFPPIVAYPYHWTQKERANEDFSRNPETFAIHRWHASWQ